MRRLSFILVSLGGGVVVGLIFWLQDRRAMALMTGWMAFLLAFFKAIRCPRCQRQVFDIPLDGRPAAPKSDYCFTCERDVRDVWPLQYLVRPEPRDPS